METGGGAKGGVSGTMRQQGRHRIIAGGGDNTLS
jgi:hypothetical protein